MTFTELYDLPLGIIIATLCAIPVGTVIIVCERYFPYENLWGLPSRRKQ